MLRALVDVLKEVFWIKSPSKKTKTSSRQKSVRKPSVQKSSIKKVSAKKPPIKKLPVKKSAIPKPLKSLKNKIDPALKEIGLVTHYFERIKVAVIRLHQGPVLIGDRLTILGFKTRCVQKIWSMQIESLDVKIARKGQIIGIKVDKPVAAGDKVYKVSS